MGLSSTSASLGLRVVRLKRAFSAGVSLLFIDPGGCPRLTMNVAPLALSTHDENDDEDETERENDSSALTI